MPERLFPGMTVEQMRERWPTVVRFQPAAITNTDGEAHTRLRKLFVKAFNRPLVESMRPFVRQRIKTLLDLAAQKRDVEFNGEIARRIPGSVILHLLGMSQDYLDRLEEWDHIASAALMSPMPTLEALDRLEAAQIEMNGIFLEEIERRRREPRQDLITELLNAAEAGDKLSHEELLEALFLIIIAGHDSTANSITLGIRAMARHPEAWEYWRANSDKAVDNAIELMRYVAMISAQPRIVARDFEWHGKRLRKGDVCFLMIAAGNRDPKVFQDPEKLDFTRANDKSLVFAPGIYHCIGHLLAKLQVSEFFTALVQRFDRVEVLEEPTFTPALVFRGVNALKLRFYPRHV
ncbi:MAG: cytochrome P450 [Steroidobacteraceae bacterium]|nr:cytochrome P450 [Steroidobacteraceae bacterium]MDW8259874.1 cytochrome P450 [Gammaproteobacteria bacterium]